MSEITLSRETCDLCGNVESCGFDVSNDIWQRATESLEDSCEILCINCFTDIADQKLLKWDKNIKLFPVSYITSMEEQ